MRTVSNSTGSNSYGETSWEGGDTAASVARKKYYQELIQRANSVPLVRIFKYYNLPITVQNSSAVCPFRSHKGGKERTPSFNFYPETNSFFCFGCHTGGKNAHACEFMVAVEGINRAKAAEKILSLFAQSVDPSSIHLLSSHDFAEHVKIVMDFSTTVREFRQMHPDEKSSQFIEGICWVYDQHHQKHKYNTNDALRGLVDRLKEIIGSYARYEIK